MFTNNNLRNDLNYVRPYLNANINHSIVKYSLKLQGSPIIYLIYLYIIYLSDI